MDDKKILMLSSEVSPFARTGGLGDVLGSLPLSLRELGYDVRIIMPKYRHIDAKEHGLSLRIPALSIPMGKLSRTISVLEGNLKKTLPVYFLDAPVFFNRSELYGTSRQDYPDNAERFSFFSRACLEVSKALSFSPHIIHCHDWQTALIPVYLKALYSKDPFFKHSHSLLTIHNLGYQGLFDSKYFAQTGLPRELFSLEGVEFYGKMNFMKGGLLFAELLTTVSQTYCQEIQNEELGCGLEGVLRRRSKALKGILNGIDTLRWNPETDTALKEGYYAKNLRGKGVNKEYLQRTYGFSIQKNTPLVGMVTRLTRQKGLDLISKALNELMKMDIQLLILGTGEERYQTLLEEWKKKYPQKIHFILGFDDTAARQIYAGCDLLLMPSLYEPCGISQLISLRYGTIPIARKTGGLSDTITEFNPITGKGHGFLFEKHEEEVFLKAVDQAKTLYKNLTTDESFRPPSIHGTE